MKTVSVTARINASASAAWEIVRAGGEMDRWAPFVTSCRLEGSGVGAKRVCVVDDQELRESIETVDDEARLFQYRIVEQTLMPVRDVLGTIRVGAIGSAEAEILWFVNFELDDDRAWPAVKAGIEGMYRAAIDGLEVHANRVVTRS